MSNLSEERILSDVAEIVAGTSPTGSTINDIGIGVPFFQGSAEFGLRNPTIERFTTSPVKMASPGDILLSVRAPVGRVNIASHECAIGRGLMAVRTHSPSDQLYLSYLLESLGTAWEAHSNDGTMFANLSKSALATMPLYWPENRQEIGNTFHIIDQRIESCQRILETTSSLISAYCQSAVTNSQTEKEISLAKAATLVNGGAFTKNASGFGKIVIRIKELNSGVSESTVYNNIVVPEAKTAFPGDVLFAWSGSLGIYRWFKDEAIVNQHIFKVLPGAHPVWLCWFHISQALEDFQDIAAGKATTMGHITKDHLERRKVIDLGENEISQLAENVEPLWEYQLQIGREIEKLLEMRNFILPKLISGEIQILGNGLVKK
jgi:type I restriction enzyme S subunit